MSAFVLALTAVPNSKISADELIKANPEETQCPAPLVLQLDVPDSVAKKRLARAGTPTIVNPCNRGYQPVARKVAFLRGIRLEIGDDLHLAVSAGAVSPLLTNNTALSPRYRLQTLWRDSSSHSRHTPYELCSMRSIAPRGHRFSLLGYFLVKKALLTFPSKPHEFSRDLGDPESVGGPNTH